MCARLHLMAGHLPKRSPSGLASAWPGPWRTDLACHMPLQMALHLDLDIAAPLTLNISHFPRHLSAMSPLIRNQVRAHQALLGGLHPGLWTSSLRNLPINQICFLHISSWPPVPPSPAPSSPCCPPIGHAAEFPACFGPRPRPPIPLQIRSMSSKFPYPSPSASRSESGTLRIQ